MAIDKVLNLAVVVIAVTCCALSAQVSDPFEAGYSMGNFGAIVQTDGPGGRQPWVPAAYHRDTLLWGVSFAALSFYGRIDNLNGPRPHRTKFGGWISVDRLTVKTAMSFFTVHKLYSEHNATVSVGYELGRFNGSAEFENHRYGIKKPRDVRSVSVAGVSMGVVTTHVFVTFSVSPLLLHSNDDFYQNDVTFRSAIHTVPNQFGSQGVVLEITPQKQRPVRLIVGEEYRFTPGFGVNLAVAGNPTLVSFGVVFEPGAVNVSAGMVNHTSLGWSKGVALDYVQ